MTIGFDIGGTHIAAVAISDKRIIKKTILNTPKSKPALVLIIKKIAQKFGDGESDKIGIAVAGITSGTVLKKAPNIPYLNNFDFGKIFPKPYIIRVDNDARSFLRANLFDKPEKTSIAFTIGTGIGRAYADKGKVKTIKKFEYPEKWEKQYQKVRSTKSTGELAEYLGTKLSAIVKYYNPEQIIIGGGVVRGRGKKFVLMLKKYFRLNRVNVPVKIAPRKAFAGAFGSALIFNQK